jgi:replication initiation protein RepC
MPSSSRLAEQAREERELMGRLRRRATIARNGIVQILETAAEYGFQGEEWSQLAQDTQGLAWALRRPERPETMALGVERLERLQKVARERLAGLLKAVDSDPWGPKTDPTNITTKQLLILTRIP